MSEKFRGAYRPEEFLIRIMETYSVRSPTDYDYALQNYLCTMEAMNFSNRTGTSV